ncbi:uncharacterized protein EbC_39490 [Erwinia billingiae Eb661]|uniref:Uncharacterized protein n=1 Tax=Erwinia billingiae (strain Eb661) TaxID=634500 RepID=D8MXC3_ERWBE|nr:uncharacterized protein EbC_39490 [Erwinia billingiae Eb661]
MTISLSQVPLHGTKPHFIKKRFYEKSFTLYTFHLLSLNSIN